MMTQQNNMALATALDRLLEEKILPDKHETKKFRATFDKIMAELIPILKTDLRFGILFQNVDLVGSTPSKLRVRQFNEFDVHLVLKDFFRLTRRLQVRQAGDGFIYFRNFKTGRHRKSPFPPNRIDEDWARINKALLHFQDEDGYIVPEKVISSLHSAVQSALPRLTQEINVELLQRNGPAITLRVTDQKRQISIDLVPVFQFPWCELPRPPLPKKKYRCLSNIEKYKQECNATENSRTVERWSAVGKPSRVDPRTWMLDFWQLGKHVLRDKENMKNGIRVMKWLRNCESGSDDVSGTWRHLSSYIIKNEFFWKDAETGGELWKKDIGTIIIDIIQFIVQELKMGDIRDFWCPAYNLLGRARVEGEHWDNIANRLERIKNGLEGSDPAEAVQRYFTRPTAKR